MDKDTDFSPHCPRPFHANQQILMAHGGGGRLMNQLLDTLIKPAFNNRLLMQQHDGAVFVEKDTGFAFTTDSYVVKPLFFPGGNIGHLAVYGTVNDLAMCGAKPLFLSAGFIIEEGFNMNDLDKIVVSMKLACERTGVKIITGDTKVVEKGKGDGIYINTSGIGMVNYPALIGPKSIQGNDIIIVSGDIGRHGIAVLAARKGFSFETPVTSDIAPLNALVQDLIGNFIEIHCLRDLTRGGLATALIELAESKNARLRIDESAIPLREEIKGVCEILGYDPLYLANEGRFVAFIPEYCADQAVSILKQHEIGENATIIGKVISTTQSGVILKTQIGTNRVLDMLSGEQLPRIC